MSVRTVSLNDVSVTDKATHIVIYQGSSIPSNTNDNMISELKTQVFNLTRQVEELSKKLLHLELGLPKASPFFSANVAPEPEGLEVRRLSEIPRVVETSNSSVVFKAVVSKLPASSPPAPTLMEVDDEGEVEEAGEAASAAGEEEEAEAEEAGEAEEEEASEAGEEEAEEEALELEEFEYKGVTYFKDSENQVYEKDDDGDLNDTPIGVWNEEKKKVLKYKS
jgi:hypothetical protein